MNRTARLLLAIALAAAGCRTLAADPVDPPRAAVWYRSNSLGLPLEEIDPAATERPEYTLRVQRERERETRTLYRQGEEIERWEEKLDLWGARLEVLRFARGVAVEIQLFDEQGRIREERQLRDGAPAGRTLYYYGSGGLSRTETYDADGRLIAADRYRLSPRGDLRGVRREGPDGLEESYSLVRGAGQLFEERLRSGAGETFSYYDASGRLLFRELWREGERQTTLEYVYRGETMESMVETDLRSGSRTVRTFDERGELRREEGQRDDTEVFRDPAGRPARRVRRGESGLEEWLYAYDRDGRLEREEYRQKGALVKVTRFMDFLPDEAEPRTRVEELYREGQPFLRVTYREGERVREEVLMDGQVTRVREWEPR